LPGECGDASTRLMRANSGVPGGVTFVQFAPPSRVTCTRPSSEPTQIVPASWYDGAMVKITAYVSTPVWSFVMGPPDGPIVFGSCRVRSGLMRSQVWPSFVVFHRCCEPTYSTFGPVREYTIGNVHWKRSRISDDEWPIGFSGHTLTARRCPVARS